MAKPVKKSVSTNPAAPAPAEPAKEAPAQKVVEAVSQKLVQVAYSLENHHHLDGVHAVRKGINHLPEHIWEKAKKMPANAKLLADGHLSEVKDEEESE